MRIIFVHLEGIYLPLEIPLIEKRHVTELELLSAKGNVGNPCSCATAPGVLLKVQRQHLGNARP